MICDWGRLPVKPVRSQMSAPDFVAGEAPNTFWPQLLSSAERLFKSHESSRVEFVAFAVIKLILRQVPERQVLSLRVLLL